MNYLGKIWNILTEEYKKKIIILFFLIIFSVFFEVLGIGLIVPLIIFLLEDNVVDKYPLLSEIAYFFSHNLDKSALIQISLVFILLVYFIKNLLVSIISYYESKLSWGVQADIQRRLFEYYISEDLIFHTKKNSANLINNTTKEISLLFHLIFNTVIFFSEIFVFVGIALLLIFFQPIAFFSIMLISLLTLGTYSYFTKEKISELGKIRQLEDGLIIQKIQQGLGGIRELKIYNREKEFKNLFFESNWKLFNVSWKNQFLQKIPRPLLEFSAVFSMIAVVFIFFNLNFASTNIIAILALFGVAAVRVLPSLVRVFNSVQSIQFSKPALDLIHKELQGIKIVKKEIDKKNIQPINFNKEIKIVNLSFKYPDSKNLVFDKINLSILKGKLTGIKGPSGSGKSTLVDIILGLLKPEDGKILIDGKNISVSISNWQKIIGYVPQNVFLIDDSIKKNIAFGIEEKKIDDDKISQSIINSELDSYIENLPKKAETVIGERGSRLSGGQRQRIGLARALYHEPDLLVLDETTSSLESDTEKKIMETIIKLQKNKTIILITHNQNLINQCNNIFLIKNKKIIQAK